MKIEQLFEAEDNYWYHGTRARFTRFDPRYAAVGNAQEGPGFYFTKNINEAKGYGNRVLKCELDLTGEMHVNGPINRREIEYMIERAPDLEMDLTNWDEYPEVAFNKAVESMITYADGPKDAFESVWADFYRDEAAEWIRNVVRLGYTHTRPTRTDNQHIIMFDPNGIELVEIIE